MRKIIFLLAALLPALIIVQPAVQAATDGKIFSDWKVTCEKTADDIEVCHIGQGLASKEDGKPVMHIAVGHVPGKDQRAAIITLPLGIALRPGIQIKIDEGDPIALQPNVCVPSGCQIIAVMDDALLKAMKKGTSFYVAFYTVTSKQARTVKVSLAGFTAAYNSLGE